MCWRPATLLKETPRQVFPCKFCEIFKKTLFCRTLRWLLLFFVNPYLPQLLTVTRSSGDLCRLDTNSVVWFYPSIIYMFKVNNGNTRTMCEICSKLTIKTTERRHIFHTLFWCYHCWLWTSECHLGSLILRLFEQSTRHNDGIFN